jgi:hypothetical protein
VITVASRERSLLNIFFFELTSNKQQTRRQQNNKNMTNYNSKAAPVDAGTATNLPPDILKRAHVRSPVIAWSHLDPELQGELGRFLCTRIFGAFLFCPCFWPHLCFIWPCLYSKKVALQEDVKSQWWILTQDELKILATDHDTSCCPGTCRTGDRVKSIPLENITDCGLNGCGTGIGNKCAGDLPSVYVDTASSGGSTSNGNRHEAVGLALKNYEWLIQQILDRRDIVKGRNGVAGGETVYDAPMAQVVDDRGGKSAEERLAEVKALRDKGILTEEEFQQKRQEIIAAI